MEPEEDDGIMSYKTYADMSDISGLIGDRSGYSDANNLLAEQWLASNQSRVARRQERKDKREERMKAKKDAQNEAIKKLVPGILGVAAVGIGAYLMNKKKQEANKKIDHIEDEIIEVVEQEDTAGQCTIQVTNLTDVDTKVVLFGANKNLFATNYGNNPAIHIEIANSNTVSYAQLLAMTQVQPFEVALWRFIADDEKQIFQGINFTHTNAMGMSATTLLTLHQFITANQMQSNMVDVKKSVVIDANLEISFTLKAKTKLQITMFKTAQKFTDISDLSVDNKEEDPNAGVNFLTENGLI